MSGHTVVAVPASATHALRRSMLRDGDPGADVHFPTDDAPGAFHLGVVDDGDVVAVASFAPAVTGHAPGRRAVQLRGMAVVPGRQGQGLGRALLDAAVARLPAEGVEVLWANARDSALGFYEGYGMTVVGDGFVTPDTGLPHHVVLLALTTAE